MGSSRPLVVIGHKNPDTDSICPAIAYARFKREIAGEPAAAYRAGSVNKQTQFVLDRFHTNAPPLLTDLYPKISDITIKGSDLLVVREQDTLGFAQELIVSNRFSFLPVVESTGTCSGIITSLRLAELTADLTALTDRAGQRMISLEEGWYDWCQRTVQAVRLERGLCPAGSAAGW